MEEVLSSRSCTRPTTLVLAAVVLVEEDVGFGQAVCFLGEVVDFSGGCFFTRILFLSTAAGTEAL